MDVARRLSVEVLGPLRVTDAEGVEVTPDGNLQRRLFALLVLRRGDVVTVDAALGVLWPGPPPRDPVAALQNHVSRLRQALPPGLIGSVGEGYRLETTSLDVDVDRFSRLIALATGGDSSAITEIEACLSGWRGPAYPELDDVDDGRVEAVRLEDLRLRAREVIAELRLARGEHEGLVADLTALVAAEPLRERPRTLLMAALAATGRRVEALRVYDDYRRLLGEELGIEPSPELIARHAELLDHGGAPTWDTPDRLPQPTSSLVGRHDLLVAVTGQAEAHRLVTLVGPGGVGKTRLLLEVGHRLRAARPDRPVVLCELATADPAAAADAAAAALGIDTRPGVSLRERLAEVLQDTEIVVLLDNCEHVLEPMAEFVEHLLARCPGARVVATSRERLRVAGEQLRTVPALDVAGIDGPAVRLFLERAEAVVPGFAPGPEGLDGIAEIVRRLDGLPLAIELAAARLHTHDLAEVAAGLDQRFALLSTGVRTSSRHASLGAAVAWSVGLLDESLRRTFADVSVFVGPFGVADAASVCAISETEATAALSELVERSLVLRTPGRRYVLLETLRAYGAEMSTDSGRADTVQERHAVRQVEWVEEAHRQLADPDRAVLVELDEALPELRAACTWLVDQRRAELAGRLVSGLLDYGFFRVRPDVLAWAERVAEIDPDDAGPMAPQVWVIASYAAWMTGDLAEAGRRSRRALRIVAGEGEPPSRVAMMCGNLALFEGRLAEAAEWYVRSAASAGDDMVQRRFVEGSELLARGYAGDPGVVDLAAARLAEVGDAPNPVAAYLWYCAGEADLAVDAERARRRLTRALEMAEVSNATFITGSAGASRASLDARTGDPQAAAEDYRRLIAHWRRAGMWATQWTMLRAIAGLLARLGRDREAAVLVGAVRATTEGHRIFGADETALTVLADRLRAALGDEAYDAAVGEGGRMGGDATVDLALRALSG